MKQRRIRVMDVIIVAYQILICAVMLMMIVESTHASIRGEVVRFGRYSFSIVPTSEAVRPGAELFKTVGPYVAGLWVLLGWAIVLWVLLLLRKRRLLSLDRFAITYFLVGAPFYGLWFYFRKMRNAPVRGVQSSARRRQLLDVWFALLPLFIAVPAMTLMFHTTDLAVRMFCGMFPVIFLANVPTIFWCLLKVDVLDRGWRKFLWQALAFVLWVAGPTLCYFLHLRGRDLHDVFSPAETETSQ